MKHVLLFGRLSASISTVSAMILIFSVAAAQNTSVPSPIVQDRSLYNLFPVPPTDAERAAKEANAQAEMKLYNQGKIAMEKGDWNLALTFFNQLQNDASMSSLIEVQTARHAFETGDYPTALVNYNAAALWLNGHIQSFDFDDDMIYAFLLMQDGQSDKAIGVYADAYPGIHDQGWYDRLPPTPIPYYSKDNPPNSPSEFEAAALSAAGSMSAEGGIGGKPITFVDQNGKVLGPPYDPSEQPYHAKIALQRLNMAAQMMPSSPYPHFYMGMFYKNTPGHETDAAEEFHKAWENSDSQMEPIVLNEIRRGTPEFVKAANALFTDIPH